MKTLSDMDVVYANKKMNFVHFLLAIKVKAVSSKNKMDEIASNSYCFLPTSLEHIPRMYAKNKIITAQ